MVGFFFLISFFFFSGLALHSAAVVDAGIPVNPSCYSDKQADPNYAVPDTGGDGMASSTPDAGGYEVFRDPAASGHVPSSTPDEVGGYEVFRDTAASGHAPSSTPDDRSYEVFRDCTA